MQRPAPSLLRHYMDDTFASVVDEAFRLFSEGRRCAALRSWKFLNNSPRLVRRSSPLRVVG